MFGCLSFYKEAAREARCSRSSAASLATFRCLAATAEGYKNLIWLASHVPGAFPNEENVDPAARARSHTDYLLKCLEGRTKGLIGLTGCMGGPLGSASSTRASTKGAFSLANCASASSQTRCTSSFRTTGCGNNRSLNGVLHDLSLQHGLQKVATNDVHYAERGDADAQIVLGCIKNQRQLAVAKTSHHGSSEMYLKSGDEMAELFTAPTLAATLEIAEKCSGLKLVLNKPMLPNFPVPEGYTTESYFRHLAWGGLKRRLDEGMQSTTGARLTL